MGMKEQMCESKGWCLVLKFRAWGKGHHAVTFKRITTKHIGWGAGVG